MTTLPLRPLVPRRRRGPVAWLVLLNGPRAGMDFRLQGSTTVGRSPRSTLPVDDETVSYYHAKLRLDHGRYVLHDLASTAGTYLNGRLVERQTLEDGDIIQLGQTQLKFKQA